ncbi:hypothetical protein OESDEN_03891, partial [Oesophagostomum dentatum]
LYSASYASFRSSLENCEVASESSYLPGSEPGAIATPENPYYEKLIGIDADPTAYPEDLIMIGSSVDIRDVGFYSFF